jgi:thioredoxin reductase
MAVDTPARIAVLGAGPIGIEAALYGRYLGYDVDVYERGPLAANVQQWGHVRMFSPWRWNVSTLGLAALAAQDPAWRPPEPDRLPTGQELVERYLVPLAHSDLVVDSLRLGTEVLAVGREGLLKGDLVADEARSEPSFRLLVRDRQGERYTTADVVLDCTGTFGNHNWLGTGGLPALGELAAASQIEYGLPDIAGADRARYANRRVLVIGGGHSAATNVLALASLAEEEPHTRILWVVRRAFSAGQGPLALLEHDPLAERERLAREANRLAAGGGKIECLPQTSVRSLIPRGGGFVVGLEGAHAGEREVDQIIANVGWRPDRRIYEELQVHECYATAGPMKLAAALLAAGGDCLAQPAVGAEALLHPEMDYYILGAKSYGRRSPFLLRTGHQQIRDVFRIIFDRPNLDLYATHRSPYT